MATKKKPVKKPVKQQAAKPPAATAAAQHAGPRRLKRAQFRAVRFRRRTKQPIKLPSAFKLTKLTFTLLWEQRRLFVGIVLIYAILNLLLVRGFSTATDVGSLRTELNQAFSGHFAGLASGLTVFTVLLSSSGSSSSDTGGVYQLILALIVSLAVIWGLRHVLAKERVRIRDTFYRGMYPLIPFILILIVVLLELLPLIIGGTIYALVVGNGIAVGGFETFLFLLLFIALSCLTLYLICSSIFALYIVTLPEMTPMKALKSARQLVRDRRLPILRKVLFLPLMLLVVAAVLVLPCILFVAPVAQWLFFGLTMLALVVVHTYMYILYRELLA